MKILAIDTATNVMSAAVLSEKKLISEDIIDYKLKHSKTLMPTLDSILKSVELSYFDFDYFAAVNGPGSFTGLRIGLSTIKALAQVTNKPVIPVSTLESLAYNISFSNGIICPILDARREQVYTALFESSNNGTIKRLTEDSALYLSELRDRLKGIDKPIFLLGDGVDKYAEDLESFKNLIIVPAYLRTCKASSAGACALSHLDNAKTYKTIEPSYLRPSYAEEKN